MVVAFEVGVVAVAGAAGVATGLLTGTAETAGVAAGAAVVDFGGVGAGAAATGAVAAVAGAADVVDFFERLFMGVALSAPAAADAGAVVD